MLNFNNMLELINEGDDPNALLPNDARKKAMKRASWVQDRAGQNYDKPDIDKDRYSDNGLPFARQTERPKEISYHVDYRSKLSQLSDPESMTALRIDQILNQLAGRTYEDPMQLATKISEITRDPINVIAKGLTQLYKFAPHLFDKSNGRVTVKRVGNPNDKEGNFGGRYKGTQVSANPIAGSGLMPMEKEKQAHINSLAKTLLTQKELHNQENVREIANRMNQELEKMKLDGSQDLKAWAATIQAKVQKYIA